MILALTAVSMPVAHRTDVASYRPGYVFSLEDRTGLVTGASRGIGRAIATELAAAGARLAVHGRTLTPNLRAFAESLERPPRSCKAFAADLSDPGAVRAFLRQLSRWSSRLDFVVANAGVYAGTPSVNVPESEWDAMLGVNLRGSFRIIQGALPLLQTAPHPSVVLVSSILATRASSGGIPYQASKAAVEQMTRALALELAPRIRVNAVAPGYVRTDMNRTEWEDSAFYQHVRDVTPLGRWGEPTDIAPIVRYLLSEEAAWVTGSVLLVDGGLGLE